MPAKTYPPVLNAPCCGIKHWKEYMVDKTMLRKSMYNRGACSEGLRWFDTTASTMPLEDVWLVCHRADWMWWLMDEPKPSRPFLYALFQYTLNQLPKQYEMACCWLFGAVERKLSNAEALALEAMFDEHIAMSNNLPLLLSSDAISPDTKGVAHHIITAFRNQQLLADLLRKHYSWANAQRYFTHFL